MKKVFDFIFSHEKEKTKKEKEKIKNTEIESIEFQKKQKIIREKIQSKEQLDNLKDLVSAGIIYPQAIENILSGESVWLDEMKKILDKIDEIDKIDIDNKVIPKKLKFTSQEYIDAFKSPEKKEILLSKINQWLEYIYQSIWWTNLTFSLFSFLSYNLYLSKEVELVQWNLIDIKNNILTH